ncbi:hypothetical protein [Pelagibaculum spongiae]|uniref:Uncharacterized protein n=1 Tax=Pelagibaculum spongiae TaxID=2080658 RepID=A0A2V1GWH9_9GAMM|nr:hypothetical protein [Pelagibaculum spongiae]PVZ69027.1 hypothetical protein DC094_12405 [Pelagibaculum spongiae]
MLFSWPPFVPPKPRTSAPKRLVATQPVSSQRNRIDSEKSWLDQQPVPSQFQQKPAISNNQTASGQLLRQTALGNKAYQAKEADKLAHRRLLQHAKLTGDQKNSRQHKGSQLDLFV